LYRLLSKSRVLAVRQCARRLWLEVHRPDLRVYVDDTRRRFEQGRRLNILVRQLYPDGVLIDEDLALENALELTAAHLAGSPHRPLFEATFSAHGTSVRADIIRKSTEGFELTEVKSSTRLKLHHLDDCAVQHWIISEAGYRVAKTTLAHINTKFVYQGNGDYSGLMRHLDVTERVIERLPRVPDWIEQGVETLSLPKEPEIATGPHCNSPFSCPFMDHCSPQKTTYPVERLPGGGRIVQALLNEGIRDIREIPDHRLHKPLQERVRQVTVSGVPYVSAEIGETLQALPYPRYYLDFEAIQFAIPRWANTRPYQQLPFQWSCHLETSPGELEHREFLDDSGEPPMRACAETLVSALGTRGPVFSYSNYERTVIHQLAARFPDLAQALRDLSERLVDLLPLVKAHYYHPAMKGSFSVKAVLPTVAPELSYQSLGEVQDGVGAQIAYEQLIDKAVPSAQRQDLPEKLKEYCRLDTLVMVKLVWFLEKR